jgi:hypothetical protein
VQAFRREPRNAQIFEQLNQDVRDSNARSFRLMALFVPGVAILGTIATVTALFYGGYRVLDGDLQVGVLTSFLLYLRRFFDPMQDIAVFFNSFQSASAAAGSRPGSGSWSRSPGRSWPTLRCSSSTRRPRRWTCRASGRSSGRCTPSSPSGPR